MLFLDLDDAMKVLKWHGFLDEGYEDPDGLELVRSELEQKCYIKTKDDTISKVAQLACDINPKEIAAQIEHDNLGQWCENIQAEFTACVAKYREEDEEKDEE